MVPLAIQSAWGNLSRHLAPKCFIILLFAIIYEPILFNAEKVKASSMSWAASSPNQNAYNHVDILDGSSSQEPSWDSALRENPKYSVFFEGNHQRLVCVSLASTILITCLLLETLSLSLLRHLQDGFVRLAVEDPTKYHDVRSSSYRRIIHFWKASLVLAFCTVISFGYFHILFGTTQVWFSTWNDVPFANKLNLLPPPEIAHLVEVVSRPTIVKSILSHLGFHFNIIRAILVIQIIPVFLSLQLPYLVLLSPTWVSDLTRTRVYNLDVLVKLPPGSSDADGEFPSQRLAASPEPLSWVIRRKVKGLFMQNSFFAAFGLCRIDKPLLSQTKSVRYPKLNAMTVQVESYDGMLRGMPFSHHSLFFTSNTVTPDQDDAPPSPVDQCVKSSALSPRAPRLSGWRPRTGRTEGLCKIVRQGPLITQRVPLEEYYTSCIVDLVTLCQFGLIAFCLPSYSLMTLPPHILIHAMRGRFQAITNAGHRVSKFVIAIAAILFMYEDKSRTHHNHICSICFQSFSTKDCDTRTYDRCCRTPCNHRFHAGCLVRWLDKQVSCPVCHGSLAA